MDFLGSLKGRVENSMNEELSKAFTKEEIYAALQQMKPTIAPGPNGMPPIFF